ncbi:hypothetical protein [Pumilibacter muris]|uniref:hypothetical protein n=1 Tax=Pumilibacter muris TaxID=2941510 RepID=UPI002040EC43|nr:hypothetical protein [Pumilibacter muris]
MVKVAKQQDGQNAQPRLPITATVVVHESGFGKDKRAYIAADLINPFEGEDFEVELSPKWKSDKGIFDYKARKLLNESGSFTVNGYLTPVTFYSKKNKKDMTVVSCFIDNPFFAGDIEFRADKKEQYSVLAFYCSEAWNIKLSRYYDEETPVSDDSEE